MCSKKEHNKNGIECFCEGGIISGPRLFPKDYIVNETDIKEIAPLNRLKALLKETDNNGKRL